MLQEKQTTHKCHIIPKRYMRQFKSWWNKPHIYYVDLNNLKWKPIFEDKDWDKCNYWYHEDAYNFLDFKWNIVDWLEKYYAKLEDNKGKSIRLLTKNLIQNIENWKNHLDKNEKDSIIWIISIIYEKIAYYHFIRSLSTEEKVVWEREYYYVTRLLIFFKIYWNCFLKILLNKKFKRTILYCKRPLFFFWDVPFHITTNWENSWLESFLKNRWSNIIFPLSKNFMIWIENNQDVWYWECCVHIQREDFLSWFNAIEDKETLKSAILNRCVLNFQEYVAWPNKKIIKKALKSKKHKNIYNKDVFIYATIERTNKIMKPYFMKIEKDLYDIDKNEVDEIIRKWIKSNLKIMNYIDKLIKSKTNNFIWYIINKTPSEVNNLIKSGDFEKILWNFEIYWGELYWKLSKEVYP